MLLFQLLFLEQQPKYFLSAFEIIGMGLFTALLIFLHIKFIQLLAGSRRPTVEVRYVYLDSKKKS